jgi:DNA polymerase-3 subunit epsilon
MAMREVVLDTETTGLEPAEGHRVIEIGCVEIEARRLTGRHYHIYLQPDREIDPEAVRVHGITNDFLADKPRFPDVSEEFFAFLGDARLVIHNAPFDLGFLDNEARLLGRNGHLTDHHPVCDTLMMARRMFPGQRASLDALCKRFEVDNSGRSVHGALLDAELLARVYLAMTAGQESLSLESAGAQPAGPVRAASGITAGRSRATLPVVAASAEELAAHQRYLDAMEAAGGPVLWHSLEAGPGSAGESSQS